MTTTIPLSKEQTEGDHRLVVQTILEEKSGCECKRELPNENWVGCDNERNCKGTVWYHYSCAGFNGGDGVEDKVFICKHCRAAEDPSAPIE